MALSLYSIYAVLILSIDDSSRVFAKYYNAPHPLASKHTDTIDCPSANPYPTLKDERAFEKGLLNKTAKQTGDITLYDNRVVVFKIESDVMLYAVGAVDENEILIYNAILALRDSLNIVLKNSTDKRTIIENYDLVCLTIDELIDDGVILETDPVIVTSRVSRQPPHDFNSKNIDLSEQGLLNVWEFGKRLGERWSSA